MHGSAAAHPSSLDSSVSIHESSYVDEGVEIGAGTSIWHFCHVMTGSRIGRACRIGQNVVIGPRAVVGNGVKIQNNVSVYEGVTLEDDVFCGPSMVFTNVATPRAAVPRRDEYRTTLVGRGATLGANCTIVCGVTIGQHAFVAAGAVVTRDVKPFALVAGVPARHVGWMSAHGERLPLPIEGLALEASDSTGCLYRLEGAELRQVTVPINDPVDIAGS
jgi:UDP-2-acetamido-3-amino-2,3-dideoxy-glucuronate N-acetyltransferase